MTLITGMLAAGGAALLVLFVVTGFFGPLFGFLAAGATAYYIWKHFEDKYKAQMFALQNPAAEVWSMPMPKAWACLKDVLSTANVQTGVSGVSNWHIQQEDTTKGFIQAQLSFKEHQGSGVQSTTMPRTVTMLANFSPEGSGTRIQITYEIFSPSGTGNVENVLKTTQELIKQRTAIEKGE